MRGQWYQVAASEAMEHRDLFQAKPSERIVAARPATSLLMPQKRHFGVWVKPLVEFSLIIKAEAVRYFSTMPIAFASLADNLGAIFKCALRLL
jgi:hypothetical protein